MDIKKMFVCLSRRCYIMQRDAKKRFHMLSQFIREIINFHRLQISRNNQYTYFDTSKCQTSSYGMLFDFLAFFTYFPIIFDQYSCLKNCIFTKLSLDVSLFNTHILVSQHAKCDYWLWRVFLLNNVFWESFIYYYMF